MITCPCNVYPLTPHFYIVKLGFTGVFIFFDFTLKHRLWVLVRTASVRRFKRVPTIYVLSKNKNIIKNFHLKIIFFTAVKYCCILHGRVCVMSNPIVAINWKRHLIVAPSGHSFYLFVHILNTYESTVDQAIDQLANLHFHFTSVPRCTPIVISYKCNENEETMVSFVAQFSKRNVYKQNMFVHVFAFQTKLDCSY